MLWLVPTALCILSPAPATLREPAWRTLQGVGPGVFAERGHLRGSPPALDGLEKVGQGRDAAWRLCSYRGGTFDIDVSLALDRNPDEPCCKLVFHAADGAKVGHMLLACGESASALRGMYVSPALRGRGLSKLLLAIWLSLCHTAGVKTCTRTINKPLLSLALSRFGFAPSNGRGQLVLVSPAKRLRDCTTTQLRAGPTRSTYVRTAFEPPTDGAALQRAVVDALDDGSVRPAASAAGVRRALTLRGGGFLSPAALMIAAAIATEPSMPPPAPTAAPPTAVACDDACMAARVARKAELLKKQDRRGAYDAKVLFGGDFQAGKRETPRSSSEDTRKKLPVVGDFLFPNDVGGVNLQTGGR